MKIAMIHATVSAVQPLTDVFQSMDPSIQIVNYVNEEMLARVNRDGKVEKSTLRAFANLVFSAAESDADGILIACSIFCAYAPLLRQFVKIPLIAIDAPMLEKACKAGETVGIVATTAAAGPTAEKQLQEQAARLHRSIRTKVRIVTEAMDALKSGNNHLHDEKIAAAAESLLDDGCDAVVLCQISMAGAKQKVTPGRQSKIMTSPEEGAAAMIALIREGK
ncbi:aspartate/glutamate racemase family protein [Caproiciproducens faecalis]|uniref:Aspartate/glutamate racemase family protein n=1 Tax=Caproiciproducens faecalis TaxID=2820301 RepID=A0ABS7DNT7_9FIRM|nr:aspartate/glutamate racemase family protein [Caproiciproducens faecalis]MBW7572974.1 aspartate/glutamate racemase family protein [Caproiciproducens faecalis]